MASDVRIVAKAMDDLADDWHWVLLYGAEELGPRLYFAQRVGTLCGLLIAAAPRQVRLFDMGAPPGPTCPRCRDGDGGPELSEAGSARRRAPAAEPQAV